MVIYVDAESRNMIYDIRKSYGFENNTVIIVTTLDKFHVYKYNDYFKYCHSIDPETYHTPELYMLWHEKTFMCNRAIEFNHFGAEWFLWVDIGCFRDTQFDDRLSKFPNIDILQRMDKSKMILFQVNDLTQEEKGIHNGLPVCYKSLRARDCIQGIFGGHKDAFPKWTQNYINVFEKFIENKYILSKDQYVMTSIAILYPESVHVVKANTSYGNIWWYFKYFFTIPRYLVLVMKTSLGLANRLFEIASCYGIAKRNNYKLLIRDDSTNLHSKIDYNTTIFKNFEFITDSELNALTKLSSLNIYSEKPEHVYEQIPDHKIINLSKDVNVCVGFFQNHGYFEDCYTEFYNKLDFSEFFNISIISSLNTNLKNEFFIHVRRGDFVQYPWHYLKNIDSYYLQAIQSLTNKYVNKCLEKNVSNNGIDIQMKFNVFSDDCEYVKNTYIPAWKKYTETMDIKIDKKLEDKLIYISEISFEFNLIENLDEVSTLLYMSKCENGSIIPNSTFSWWGSYMNKNPGKIRVMPSRWLNKPIAFKLFPKNTIVINVDNN
jgi:hypothetical protein